MGEVTPERMRQYLEYDSRSGLFYWKKSKGRAKKGKQAGNLNHYGYVMIMIDGIRRGAHQLAWLWCTGSWPVDEIDHINGDKQDNRISNLREADRFGNTRNARIKSISRVGLKGVLRHKGRGKPYMARIKVNKKNIYLGLFDTPELAHQAYCEASKKHYGEFWCAG